MYCRSIQTPEVFSTFEAPTSSISPSTSFPAFAAQTETNELKRIDNKKNARAPGKLFMRPPVHILDAEYADKGAGQICWDLLYRPQNGVLYVSISSFPVRRVIRSKEKRPRGGGYGTAGSSFSGFQINRGGNLGGGGNINLLR